MVAPISITHSFNNDPAAAKFVDAAQLDTILGNVASTLNAEIAARQVVVPDGGGLAQQVVQAQHLAPGLVATLQSNLGSVPLAVPGDGSVTTAKLVDGSVTAAKVAANAVSSTKLLDQAVTATKLADGSVTATKLAASAVGTATIADGAVTNFKQANCPPSTIKGNPSLTTAGPPVDLSPDQMVLIIPPMVGDVGGGGNRGLVPAPGAGDAAFGRVLGAGGTWVIPATIQIYSDNMITSQLWG